MKRHLARIGRDDESCGLRAQFMPVEALKVRAGNGCSGKNPLLRGTGEVDFPLQGFLCSPACSCHVCNRNCQGLELVRAEFLGGLKLKGTSLAFTCSQMLVRSEVEKEQSGNADSFFQALFSL